MFPEWTLILNAVLGLIGAFIGIKVIRKEMKIKQGIFGNQKGFLRTDDKISILSKIS